MEPVADHLLPPAARGPARRSRSRYIVGVPCEEKVKRGPVIVATEREQRLARWRVRHPDDTRGGPPNLVILALGLVAGLAAGAYIADRLGGLQGIAGRVRRPRSTRVHDEAPDTSSETSRSLSDVAIASGQTVSFVSHDPELEDRVLQALTTDPVLRECSIDIGAIAPATIELTGPVGSDAEAARAAVVAGGVRGVEQVINHLAVSRGN